MRLLLTALLLATLAAGCRGDTYGTDDGAPAPPARPASIDSADAAPLGDGYESFSEDDLERGRLDRSWRIADTTAASDTTATSGPAPRPATAPPDTSESWADIAATALNEGPARLPVGGDGEGPSVLRVQILLDRARFSPGILDGKWGKNTEKAVYWLQKREGLPATGEVDEATYRRLRELAASPTRLVIAHTLTEEEATGPYEPIPDDIYEKAEMDRLGYTSLLEYLSETFHATPALLEQLNPDMTFDGLAAGTEIMVPNVAAVTRDAAPIAKLVISDRGHFVHAVDSAGTIVFHFPSTLGSSYDPSPQGDYEVTSITEDPWWHYQPAILAHVPDDQPDARIPPGPNNAVGAVWMALSKPHYGIHGTSAPETIGYATSAGCVRLTNWDVLFLARQIEAGTPVEFRDVEGGV